jgi:hypothetical protein
LFPEDVWYVIPIDAIQGRRSLYFYPNGSQRGLAMYEEYREAWWLMKPEHAAGGREKVRRGAEAWKCIRVIPESSSPKDASVAVAEIGSLAVVHEALRTFSFHGAKKSLGTTP